MYRVMRRRLVVAAAVGFAVALLGACSPPPATGAPRIDVSRLPLAFEPNSGQAPADVRFVSRGAGHGLWLSSIEARFIGPGPVQDEADAIRLRWLGGAASPAVVAEDALPGKAHYYRGPAPGDQRLDVPMYGRVVYRHVYPGIDL